MSLRTYLIFDGNCREAFKFYRVPGALHFRQGTGGHGRETGR